MKEENSKEVEVKGTIENVIYSNSTNGFTVFSMSEESSSAEIVCTGNMEQIVIGEYIVVKGKYIWHPTYGKQISVVFYEKSIPDTKVGMEKYLGSGIIKGIREVTAKKIVKKFGEQTFTIIEEYPEKLAEIKGITLEKAKSISEAFHEQKDMRHVMMFLQQYGISPVYANKIYKKYRRQVFDVVNTNPYRLADDIAGIGFKMADNIAFKVGIEKESPNRVKAGIKYVLNLASNNGHIYLPRKLLFSSVSELLEVAMELIENALTTLHLERAVWQENLDDEAIVYLNYYYYAESYVAKKLLDLSASVTKDSNEKELILKELDNQTDIVLAEKQKEAVMEVLESGVLIITGGPGTGKTTTINTIIKVLKKQDFSIELTAPTGRASKRMSEATGMESKTIHRLLEIEFLQDNTRVQQFGKNEDNPIEADVIIVDESSMIDTMLMYSLLKAVALGTRLILVGDVDQLPSVGAGNVLSDIIKSNCLNVVMLTEIFRQARESAIVMNAHKINKGEYPSLTGNEDFFFVKRNLIKDVVDSIVDLVSERLPKYKECDIFKNIQVITPMRKSPIGVQNLNSVLQQRLNPPSKDKKDKEYRHSIFREGDKVMQVRNNYNITWTICNERGNQVDEGLGIFNGDMGVIISIDEDNSNMKVIFDENKIVYYDFTQLDDLELAYAITVHKSQGSEYKVVVMPIHSGSPLLMSRNLLYTALTRARELAVIVGIPETLNKMVDNDKEIKRYTTLHIRLQGMNKIISVNS